MLRHEPQLHIVIERGRCALVVVAHTPGAACGEGAPALLDTALLVEARYAGGPEGFALRVTKGGETQAFSQEEIARHPAILAVLRLIADEVDLSKRPSEALLAFLFRSLLVYVERVSGAAVRRLGHRVRDRRVERAILLLEGDLSQRWTVERLARAVGLSRPVFARRFLRALGRSPMRYLTQRRMQLAAALLLDPEASLAEVATRVGYQSEFAFSRAFKRHHALPPGQFRGRTPTTLGATLSLAA